MNAKILIVGIVVACIVVAGVGAYFVLKGPRAQPGEFQRLDLRKGIVFFKNICG